MDKQIPLEGFRGRNFIYSVAIATMLIPTVGTLSATYKLMVDLHLYNRYIGIFTFCVN